MKKKLFLLFALLAFIAAACTRDNLLPENNGKDATQENPEEQTQGYQDPDNPNVYVGGTPITFSAIMDDEQSVKSTLIGTTVSWEPGDAISILWDGGRTVATTASTGATAVFETSVGAASAYYAVYPSSVTCDLTAADNISVTVPATQDGTFSSANINVAKTTATTFAFKAVGNIIKFTVTDADVTKVKIYSYDKSPIAGTCNVDVSGAAPVVSSYTSTADVIEVTVSGAGTYYAVALPGTHAEGLLFAPETATSLKRSAYAEKSFTFIRKGLTDFGTIENHLRDLYVSSSGTGKGLTESAPMSPADFTTLLSQPLDGELNQDNDVAVRHHRLLYGNTIHVLNDIAIGETKVEFVNFEPCKFTITGASAATKISATGTNRLFRFSNNTDVTFSGITLSGGNPASGNGGAIEIDTGSSGPATVTCNNVTFSGNTAAGNGGAVSIFGRAQTSEFIADGCTFSSNTASGNGGVVYHSADGDALAAKSISTFTNCTFDSNSASKGGVMQVYRGTANFGASNVFTKNSATDGGVFYVNNDNAAASNLNVTGGTFGGDSYESANDASGTTFGGGVLFKEGGNVSFTDAVFKYNTASANNGGVAFFTKNIGTATFTSCTFSYNKATKNGGVVYFTNNSEASFVNCVADHNTAVSGGFCQIWKGTLNIDGSSSDYRQNTATSDGGCIYMNNADAKLNIGLSTGSGKIRFFQNSAPYGGVIVMESSDGTCVIKNANFDQNTATNRGGALGIFKGTVDISNSYIMNNRSDSEGAQTSITSLSNESGRGGGIYVKGAEVNIADSYFYNNTAGVDDNSDSKNYGGAIGMHSATVNCVRCKFEGNKGNRGSVLFMIDGAGGMFTADQCAFYGNKQYSRGVFLAASKNIVYLNRCSFYNNQLRGNSGVWGIAFHGSGSSALCMNNCSVTGPDKSYGSNVAMLNTDGNILLTNNTVIGNSGIATVRIGASGIYFSGVNNVIINKQSSNNSYNISSTNFYDGYNLLGANNSVTNGTISATSVSGIDASGFTWDAHAAVTEGTPGTASYWENWFTWDGTVSGFTRATQAQAIAAYDNFGVSASAWGGCISGITDVGAHFKSWLESLTPIGYTINQRGTARSISAYWPGSYQN